jgi:hypothetical protein
MHLIILARYWQYIVIAILTVALTLSVSRCSDNANEIEAVKAEHQLTLITEQAAYLAKINDIERDNNERWQNAVNQNAQTQKQIASDYADNVAIVDSLSGVIDKNNAAFIKASANARAEYTAALSNVSKDCIGEISELSRVADGHVADIIMLQKAWPKY